jgi:dTDP-4-dehydrorhamnose 3,5-epimerase
MQSRAREAPPTPLPEGEGAARQTTLEQASRLGLKAGALIEGMQLRPLQVNRDCRGSFTEIFRDEWGLCIDPVQWSVVASEAKVLRGMHIHKRHDEYVLVIQGRASVGLYDLRPGSATRGVSCLVELGADAPTVLSFPRGVLHGWFFHEPSVHLQSVSESYGTYGDDDNLGCHWADPDLGIPWPAGEVTLSERAAGFPSLKTLAAQLGW